MSGYSKKLIILCAMFTVISIYTNPKTYMLMISMIRRVTLR